MDIDSETTQQKEYMHYKYIVVASLLVALPKGCWCFKASCLNAMTSPNDNLTILQCTEDEVTIQWSIQNDLQFVAFGIHPTNASRNVFNQSLPYWNDGETGVTTVSPPEGALCLFSACYLDDDYTRHFVAPTSCSVTSPTAADDGQEVTQTITSDIENFHVPSITPESSSYRARRTSALFPQQVPTVLASVGMALMITAAVMAFVVAAVCLAAIQWRRHQRSKEEEATFICRK